MPIRNIVRFDQEKCDGCGQCVPACVENAIQIINGKACLVSEVLCDGIGACLGNCPRGAINIEQREAPEFDEAQVLKKVVKTTENINSCPFTNPELLDDQKNSNTDYDKADVNSNLRNWPVQLMLVSENAPFLKNADIVLSADCVPFTYPNFHRDFISNKIVLIACPKLDDYQCYLGKLTTMFEQTRPSSITVLRMEMPCCGGLTKLVEKAADAAAIMIPIYESTISIKGEILNK